MAEGIEVVTGVWAVAHDGATKYVGKIAETEDEGRCVTLDEAFELVLLRMPQQTRSGEVTVATVVHPMSIGLAAGMAEAVRVMWTALELFPEMTERDRETYEKLVEDARRGFRERSAEAAGIVLPKG